MTFRLLLSAAFFFLIFRTPAQVLEGLAGNAQLQREAESHFFDGMKAVLLEKPDDAARSFEKSLDINPKNPAAHFKLAEIQTDRNQYAEALRHLNEAVKLDPSNRYYLELLAQVQEMTGEWKPSIKTWRKIAVLPGQNPEEVFLSVARIYIDQKKFKEAISELNRCQKECGPSEDLYEFRMNLFMKRNDLKSAIAEGEDMLKAFPGEVECWVSFCRLLMANGKPALAREKINELIHRFPDYPAAYLMLADLLLKENDEAGAFREMKKAFLSPDLPSEPKIEIVAGYLRGSLEPEDQQRAFELCDILIRIHPGEARPFIVRGDILNQSGQRREAREMYLIARQLDRNNFALWEQLVLLDLNLNETDSMVIHTTEARKLFPNTPSFAFYNGLGLLLKKNYEAAVEALEHAARISPDNPEMQLEIFSQLGDAWYNLKQLEKSFSSYEEALAMDSLNAHVLNNYSYFLSLEKVQLEKAVRLSSRLVKLFPEDATYLDTHGWVLYQTGRYAEALEFLQKASGSSASGVIWEHFGDALFRSGKSAEAETAWKKALELGGASPELPGKIRDRKIN